MGTTRVRAVVEGHVVFGGDDLALFVAGDPAVGEGGRPLAGGVVELVVAQSQGAGHVQILDGRDDQGEGAGGDGVAERTADAVQQHADVLLGNAAGHGDASPRSPRGSGTCSGWSSCRRCPSTPGRHPARWADEARAANGSCPRPRRGRSRTAPRCPRPLKTGCSM